MDSAGTTAGGAGDVVARIYAQIEATLFEPLFAPLEESAGPVASLAFEPMLAQLLERGRG